MLDVGRALFECPLYCDVSRVTSESVGQCALDAEVHPMAYHHMHLTHL